MLDVRTVRVVGVTSPSNASNAIQRSACLEWFSTGGKCKEGTRKVALLFWYLKPKNEQSVQTATISASRAVEPAVWTHPLAGK